MNGVVGVELHQGRIFRTIVVDRGLDRYFLDSGTQQAKELLFDAVIIFTNSTANIQYPISNIA